MICGHKRQGEYNLLECILEPGHGGDHNYVPLTATRTLHGRLTVYRITHSLRWEMRPVVAGEAGVFIDGRKAVLQQAWLGDDGSVEWRDLPIVYAP